MDNERERGESGLTVLIISDDPGKMALLNDECQRAGYVVCCVSTIGEGIRRLQRLRPAIVISPLHRTYLSDDVVRFDVLGSCATVAPRPAVIALTEPAYARQAIARGAIQCISVPIKKEEIKPALVSAADLFRSGEMALESRNAGRILIQESPPTRESTFDGSIRDVPSSAQGGSRLRAVLRWVAVMPTAIVCAALTSFPVHWAVMHLYVENTDNSIVTFDGKHWIAKLITPAVLERLGCAYFVPLAYILAGCRVAPRHRFATGIALSCLLVVFLLTAHLYVGDLIIYDRTSIVAKLLNVVGIFTALTSVKKGESR